jgi:hypothetical protein
MKHCLIYILHDKNFHIFKKIFYQILNETLAIIYVENILNNIRDNKFGSFLQIYYEQVFF